MRIPPLQGSRDTRLEAQLSLQRWLLYLCFDELGVPTERVLSAIYPRFLA